MTICTLASGSKGNCTYIKSDKTEILIDAGISRRATEKALNSVGTTIGNITAIFITHEHSDHVKALEQITRYADIPLVMNLPTAQALANGMGREYARLIKLLPAGRSVNLASMSVYAFNTPHDSAGSMGYTVDCKDGSRAGVATDIGCVTDEVRDALTGCGTVVLESNHDEKMLLEGSYPMQLKKRIMSGRGHLSNKSCAEFIPYLADKGTRNFILYHLSEENNRPELAYTTSADALRAADFTGSAFSLYTAPVKESYRVFEGIAM